MWRYASVVVSICGCAADPPTLPDATATSGGSGSAATSGSRTASAGTSATGDATAAGSTSSGPGSATSDDTADTSPDTSECAMCAQTNCSAEYDACDPAVCDCWLDCVGADMSIDVCSRMCGELPFDVLMCASVECDAECSATGPGTWQQCTPNTGCAAALECANVPRHCTVSCTADADCPAPPPGSTAVCETDTLGYCILDCATGTCPAGYTCLTYGEIDLCGF